MAFKHISMKNFNAAVWRVGSLEAGPSMELDPQPLTYLFPPLSSPSTVSYLHRAVSRAPVAGGLGPCPWKACGG